MPLSARGYTMPIINTHRIQNILWQRGCKFYFNLLAMYSYSTRILSTHGSQASHLDLFLSMSVSVNQSAGLTFRIGPSVGGWRQRTFLNEASVRIRQVRDARPLHRRRVEVALSSAAAKPPPTHASATTAGRLVALDVPATAQLPGAGRASRSPAAPESGGACTCARISA